MRPQSSLVTGVVFLVLALSGFAGAAVAVDGIDPENRPISEVRVEGLQRVPEQLVRNQIRLEVGQPYDQRVVNEDIVRINHLGRFSLVQARIEQKDNGSIILTYQVVEQPVITDVQVVGNKVIPDQTLLNLSVLRAGDPVDPFLIDQGRQAIKRAYEAKGYFTTEVTVDQELLQQSGALVFRVREGDKVRIRDIRFEGNQVFGDAELKSKIKSRTYILLIRGGELSREQLEDDASAIRNYYQQRGYLDAQVTRDINVSPEGRNATVVFRIAEGPQFLVDSIRVEGNVLFPTPQIIEAMTLKVGDVYSTDRRNGSTENLLALYGKLGFIETRVTIDPLFHEQAPRVDVLVTIDEGRPYWVGRVMVRGNEITRDNVILRQVRGMDPGKRFDRSGIDVTERRLSGSALFEKADVSILGTPRDEYRDVLLEVVEKNTGSLSFGAGISSDAGVIGAIDLVQRNFDITDTPDSFGEFITGKAFRGAGQFFSLSLQPGNEVSRYAVSFREPYLFESDYLLDTSLFYYSRERDEYDEQRFGGSAGIGQRFGDVWSASVTARAEDIDIGVNTLDPLVDVVAVAGHSVLTSLGLTVARSTEDSPIFPTRGSRLSMGVTRAGALGGDWDFTRLSAQYRKYWTVDEDFLGRRTVLTLRSEIGYIVEDDPEVPIFERFFAGGHRTFRGFDYRGVGPRGMTVGGSPTDDPSGGEWLFLLGLEYNFPVYENILRVVIFTDTGTVQKNVSLDEYRVSVGAGLRIAVPFIGAPPFAFDFAYPIVKEDGDETRVLSFDIALPF